MAYSHKKSLLFASDICFDIKFDVCFCISSFHHSKTQQGEAIIFLRFVKQHSSFLLERNIESIPFASFATLLRYELSRKARKFVRLPRNATLQCIYTYRHIVSALNAAI